MYCQSLLRHMRLFFLSVSVAFQTISSGLYLTSLAPCQKSHHRDRGAAYGN